jgi:hypothetical protein
MWVNGYIGLKRMKPIKNERNINRYLASRLLLSMQNIT